MTTPISLRDLATDADPAVVCLAEALQEAIAALDELGGGDCGDCIRGLVDGANNDPDQPVYCSCSAGSARAALAKIREKVVP